VNLHGTKKNLWVDIFCYIQEFLGKKMLISVVKTSVGRGVFEFLLRE